MSSGSVRYIELYNNILPDPVLCRSVLRLQNLEEIQVY